jgi:hypothetical protein
MSVPHCHLIVAAALTGFGGDAILQIGSPMLGKDEDWGLRSYFKQHGVGEALCIAAGMMTMFYIFYFVVLRLPPDWRYLAVYGIILDWIFRKAMLFSSLKDYYAHLNYAESALWGAIPMILPLVVARIF